MIRIIILEISFKDPHIANRGAGPPKWSTILDGTCKYRVRPEASGFKACKNESAGRA
jgi:hypothetical protein